MGSITVGMIVLIGMFRTKNNHLKENQFGLFQTLLLGQSESFFVIPATIKHSKNIEYNIFDLPAKFFRNLKNYGNLLLGEKTDDNRNNIALKSKVFSAYISYINDSKAYGSGLGMGGNFIAEAYAATYRSFGFFMILLLILFAFIKYCDIAFQPNNLIWINFLLFYIIRGIIYLPRNNILDFLSDLILPLAFYPLIHIICKTFMKES